MADTVNKARLEYEASVNRQSFDQAEQEVRNRQQKADQANQKPVNVQLAEDSARRQRAIDAEAASKKKVAEETKRLTELEDKHYRTVSTLNDQVGKLAVGYGRLSGSKFGESINRQAGLAEVQVAKLQREITGIIQTMERPTGERSLASIGTAADRVEKRVERLLARLKELDRAGNRRTGIASTINDVEEEIGGGRGSGGVPNSLRGIRGLARGSAITGRAFGLSGISPVEGLTSFGGGFAAAGVGIAGIAAAAAAVRANEEAEKSNRLLAISASEVGRTYAEASTDARTFAESLSTTVTEANQVSAALLDLKQKTGSTFNGTNLAGALGTTAEAKGLSAEDLSGQIKGLTSLSPDSIRNLTGRDADRIFEDYSKSIGKSVSQLTDFEKRLAAVNAAVQNSKLLGAQAIRARDSTESEFSKLSSEAKGLVEDIGGVISQMFHLRDAIGSLRSGSAIRAALWTTPLGPVISAYRKLSGADALDEQLEADQKQQERNQALLANTLQGRKDYQAEQLKNGFKIDIDQFGRTTGFRDLAMETRKSKFGSYTDFDTFTYAEAGGDVEKARSLREDLARKFREGTSAVTSRSKSDQSSADAFRDLVRIREEFERTKRIFEGDDLHGERAEIGKTIFGAMAQYADEAREKVLALRKDLQSSTVEFANLRLPTEQNPYVQLFAEAEEAARKAQERFGAAGQAFIDQYVAAGKAARDARQFELEVADGMSAVKLEFQAAQLSKPFVELTGDMKRTLSVFNQELRIATSVPRLLLQAQAIDASRGFNRISNPGSLGTGNPDYERGLTRDPRTGQVSINEDYLAGQEFRRLGDLMSRFGNGPGLGGETARNAINKQYSDLFGRLSPAARQQVLGRSEFRDTFAGAFRGQAEFEERELGRTVQRAEVSRGGIQLARAQLAELDRLGAQPNANKDRVRSEFLSVVGALPREELTPDLQKGLIDASREEAAFRRNRETRAAEAVEETLKFQKRLIGEDGRSGAIGALLTAIQDRQEKVIVDVLDRTDTAKVSTVGQGYAAEDNQ